MCRYCLALEIPRGKSALGEKGKFWPVGHELNISFVGGTDDQQVFVKEYAAGWLEHANLKFNFNSSVAGSDIRISFMESDGSWSYIGTDSLGIPKSRSTMNFGWLDNAVVLHEFGHALGLGHEHQNPVGGIQWNVEAVIDDLSGHPNYWDIPTIMYNVIESYRVDDIVATDMDPHSIMMYSFPKKWTLDGLETSFNETLSDKDKQFVNSLYPFGEQKAPDLIEYLQFIFKSKKDLSRLKESTVCRIGELIGAGTDQRRYWKSTNVQKVWEKIQ